jgi:sugar transferase (PEP-CTERM system associated)
MISVLNRYTSLQAVLMMVTDCVLIIICLLTAVRFRFWSDDDVFFSYVYSSGFVFQVLTLLVVIEMCFFYNDLYDGTRSISRGDEIVRLAQAMGAACILLGTLYLLFPGLLGGRGVLSIGLVLVTSSTGLTRFGLERVWQLTIPKRKVVIVGNGKLAAAVANEMSRRPDLGFELMGMIAPGASRDLERHDRPMLGSIEALSEIVRDKNVSRIIIALDDSRGALPARELVRLRVKGIEIEDAHSALAALTGRVWLGAVRPSWFVFSGGFRRSPLTVVAKRAIDIASGVVGLVLFAPVMAAIAIAIRLDSKGPVLYQQTRVGLGDTLFEVLKFRSMRTDAEKGCGAQWASESDHRVTRVGRVLRKYRLDELPQFLNVLRGEMSLVGPRPERPVFVQQLREQIQFYDERHSVRPGVTGWAQVEYTYGASVEDSYRKLEYDLFYLKNFSIFFDLVIIFRTVRIVLFGGGR